MLYTTVVVLHTGPRQCCILQWLFCTQALDSDVYYSGCFAQALDSDVYYSGCFAQALDSDVYYSGCFAHRP